MPDRPGASPAREIPELRQVGLAERLLHLFFPRTCVHCREDLFAGEVRPLCAACALELRPCTTTDRTPHCSAIGGTFVYEGPARSLVTKFKYGDRPSLSKPLGAWMAGALAVRPELGADAVVPVPLHPSRLRERGYNQAELLAEAIGAERGLPVLSALERTRLAPPQAGLSRERRLVNLKGAYRTTARVEGKTLLLIDDVGTTGTTLEECAKTLKSSGASDVKALVFARD